MNGAARSRGGLFRRAHDVLTAPWMMLALTLLLLGCRSAAPPPVLPVELDEALLRRFPVDEAPSATAVGCGATEPLALGAARKIAHYRLLERMGGEPLRIEFIIREEIPHPDLICVEVEVLPRPPELHPEPRAANG